MKLIVYKNFCGELEVHWKALELYSQHHVFQSYEWVKFWQATIGERAMGCKPWVAVVLDGNDQPKMIFPFGIRTRFGARLLEFLGCDQGDFQGPLIHNEWMADISKIQSAWNLVCKALPGHDVRHFSKLPMLWSSEDNPMLKIWRSTFQDNSYSVRLTRSYDEFKLRLRSKLKADTNRQRKRLSGKGTLSFETVDSHDNKREVWLDVMIEQKRQRYRSSGVPDVLSNEAVQQFYKEIPIRLAEGGIIHFSVLRLNDQILATHWGAVYQDRFYFLMPTYDAGEWGTYSPGRLLLENLIEWCIQNGLKIFDFTIGGEDYKKDWCDAEMPLFEHLSAVTPMGLPYFCYVRLKRRTKRNKRVWGYVRSIYSWIRYGRRNGKN